MKMRGNLVFVIIIGAVVLLIIGLALPMSAKAKLLPLGVGGVTLILVAKELTGELRGKKKAEGRGDETDNGGVATAGYLAAAMWIAGFFLGTYLLGLLIATLGFVLAYMKSHGTRWMESIAYAVITTAVMYGIFQYLMEVELYPGLIAIALDLA